MAGTTPVNTGTFDDSGLSPATTYFYRVRARSVADGRYTAYSGEVSVTTPSASGPAAPSGLFPIKVKKKKITFGWTDNARNETYYDILVFDGSSFVSIGMLGANSTSVRITGLTRRTTYRFGVSACNDGGCSDVAQVTITTR